DWEGKDGSYRTPQKLQNLGFRLVHGLHFKNHRALQGSLLHLWTRRTQGIVSLGTKTIVAPESGCCGLNVDWGLPDTNDFESDTHLGGVGILNTTAKVPKGWRVFSRFQDYKFVHNFGLIGATKCTHRY